jgi:hypothetical protein
MVPLTLLHMRFVFRIFIKLVIIHDLFLTSLFDTVHEKVYAIFFLRLPKDFLYTSLAFRYLASMSDCFQEFVLH